MGGTSQFVSLPQSWANASTASEPGFQCFELNRGVFAFFSFANLSMVQGPHRLSMKWKNGQVVVQSS